MALKQDPALLKSQDRLWSLLARIPGVELAHFDPEECQRPRSVVWSTLHAGADRRIPLAFRAEEHVAAYALATDDGEESSIIKAVDQLRGYLAGSDPSHYRPPHLPDPVAVFLARHIRLDGFPVRVVRTYSCLHGGYVTSFDALRPEGLYPPIGPSETSSSTSESVSVE